MARISIQVSLEIPDGADRHDAVAYVYSAVQTMKGSLEPPHSENGYTGDPMFFLDSSQVVVSYIDNGGRAWLKD